MVTIKVNFSILATVLMLNLCEFSINSSCDKLESTVATLAIAGNYPQKSMLSKTFKCITQLI